MSAEFRRRVVINGEAAGVGKLNAARVVASA